MRLKEAVEILTKSPTAWKVTLATSARKFSDMILGSYLPILFMTRFPAYKAKFAVLNALAMASLGFASNMLNGAIGDALEKRNPLIKSQMLVASSIISIVALCTAFMAPFNFYICFAVYALHILFSSGY